MERFGKFSVWLHGGVKQDFQDRKRCSPSRFAKEKAGIMQTMGERPRRHLRGPPGCSSHQRPRAPERLNGLGDRPGHRQRLTVHSCLGTLRSGFQCTAPWLSWLGLPRTQVQLVLGTDLDVPVMLTVQAHKMQELRVVVDSTEISKEGLRAGAPEESTPWSHALWSYVAVETPEK